MADRAVVRLTMGTVQTPDGWRVWMRLPGVVGTRLHETILETEAEADALLAETEPMIVAALEADGGQVQRPDVN